MDRIFTLRLTGESLDVVDSALANVKTPKAAAEDAAFVRAILQDQRRLHAKALGLAEALPPASLPADVQPGVSAAEPTSRPRSRPPSPVAPATTAGVRTIRAAGTALKRAPEQDDSAGTRTATPRERAAGPLATATSRRPVAPRAKRDTVAPEPKPHVIRAWARQQGLALGDRGRLPQDVVERYRREVLHHE